MKRSDPLPSVGWPPAIQAKIDAACRGDKAAGGFARAAALSPERRTEIAKNAAVARWEGGERKSKYGAVKTPFRSTQGFELVAASKAEARDYAMLDLGIKTGLIKAWAPQVGFKLPGNLRYVCDALVFWSDGRVTVRDCKGHITPAFRDRQRLMLSTYGIAVELVT